MICQSLPYPYPSPPNSKLALTHLILSVLSFCPQIPTQGTGIIETNVAILHCHPLLFKHAGYWVTVKLDNK